MEMSSKSSRFRFRDHQEMENSEQSNTSSDISSVSSDDESEFQSMTAKGIKHLCSELVELKKESDEDFHENIFLSYAAFVRIFEEVEGVEEQLMQLKSQVNLQRRLVKDLIDGIYLKALSKDSLESIVDESVTAEPSSPSELEAHIKNVSETLDIFLAENRIDEAITILEMEDENFHRLQYDDNSPSDMLLLYDSAISEKKAMLALQLTLLAENPRIAAPELQKALIQLCRLGDSHLATQLLLKYYHSRIATGIHSLQCSKSYLHLVYIRELAKLVFSMISQAARSFVMLYGETSPYASELIRWACEETEVFVTCFIKYVKPISEISGGLSTAVQAVQFAMSFCSLLETQRLVLRPCLIKQIQPCMEEVLQIHVDHFKKVIGIFTATDAWILGRYLVSGILNEGGSLIVAWQQPEYYLLTNSGWKFLTLLQTITADVSPLVSLHMEGSILRGLMGLFSEYIGILETVINCEKGVIEKGGSRINLAETLPQQVSVLANLSTLEHFFFGIIRSIFRGISQSVGFQQREVNSCIQFIQAANDQLRANFCQQLMYRMMSLKTGSGSTPRACTNDAGDNHMLHDVMPSHVFQVLFLELRALNKLAEDNAFELDWLIDLLRELIEAIFDWISDNKQLWAPTEENLTGQNSDFHDQFVLDIQFLVEIARNGGWFSNSPSVLEDLMNSAFISAGLDPKRDIDDDGWAKNAANEAIQRLMEIEEMKSLSNDKQIETIEEHHENRIKYTSDSFQDDVRNSSEDSIVSEKDVVATDASQVAINTEPATLDTEPSPLDVIVEASEVRASLEEGASNEGNAAEFVINKLQDDTELRVMRI